MYKNKTTGFCRFGAFNNKPHFDEPHMSIGFKEFIKLRLMWIP
jgi:CDGSH-type Zn-finger protein